jgi:hypothetical protein
MPHTVDVTESPAVESLPETQSEFGSSFADALEAALSRVDKVTNDVTSAVESKKQVETATETVETTENTEENASETVNEDLSDDPLEQLSDNFDWTPKAANRFKELKSLLKDTRSEVEQLRQLSKEQEAKLQEMSGLVENRDIDQLQQRIAEYERDKMFVDLENTYAYQKAVSEPLSALVEQAEQIADTYNLDTEVLIDIIALNDPQAQDERLADVLAGASDRDKARVYRIIEEVNPLLERRKQLYANVETASKEAQYIEEQRQKQTLAQEAQFRKTVTENVVERVVEKLPFVKTIEGLNIDAIREKAASQIPSAIHPVDFAYNAVAAQLLPQLVKHYVALTKEVGSLTDKLSEYEDAEPKMSGGGTTPTGRSNAGSDTGFLEAVTRALGG